jgi:hypothetical protein
LILALATACGPATETTTADDASTSPTASSTGDSPPTTGSTSGAATCTPGEISCTDDGQQSVCGEDGQPGPGEACAAGSCVAGQGCVECLAGEKRCAGEELQQCGAASTWEPLELCDAAQGLACDAAAGACVGACAPAELAKAGLSASGCEFYAVTTLQLLTANTIFAVVIENPGPDDATITITQDEFFKPMVVSAPAGTATPIELPWVEPLVYTFKGELVYDGAYRLRSDRPVRAIQYSTFDADASSDSSLLWPRHVWGTEYFAGTRESGLIDDLYYPGAWAIVGGEETAKVVVTPRPGTTSKAGPGIGLDGGGMLTMNRGDVLQVLSDEEGDLNGARISADKPIMVFGAHMCGFAPEKVSFCDHLEDAMLPTNQLGTVHVPVPPMREDPMTGRRDQVVRVIATDGPTQLTYDPPQEGLPTSLPGTAAFVELPPSHELYALTTDKPVVVLQFMVGESYDFEPADPSLLATLPTARFAPTHHVHTPSQWLPVNVDITAPVGATVTIDGAPVDGWTPVGASGLQVAHVRFDEDVGLATIAGDQAIAVGVYATKGQPSASFWHHAGASFAP